MSVARVDAPGALSSLQDRGRFGWRHMGVPWSGALDPEALAVANRLVGNPPHAPAIECFEGGLMLTAEDGGVRLAVAGSARMRIDGASGSRSVDSWRSFDLEPGDCLRLQACEGRQRCALVAVHGLQVPLQLGSASTYARAQLGGMEGRNLRAGDRLSALPPPAQPCLELPGPWPADEGPIRILPGPQADHFAHDALDVLQSAPFHISSHSDRMGLRLEGPRLAHRDARSSEIVSDATVPGNIQVPGNGQPIVLLADGQTAGGYPKIATVISTDLPRLATCRPGTPVWFRVVDRQAALVAARAATAALARILASIRPVPGAGEIDSAVLMTANLAGAAVNALAPDDGSSP